MDFCFAPNNNEGYELALNKQVAQLDLDTGTTPSTAVLNSLWTRTSIEDRRCREESAEEMQGLRFEWEEGFAKMLSLE